MFAPPGQAAAVRFGNLTRHRQSQPNAALLARHQGFEQMPGNSSRRSSARVTYLDGTAGSLPICNRGRVEQVDFDPSSRPCGIDGVPQQVEEQMSKLNTVPG